MSHYVVLLKEEESYLLIEALDFHARVGMLQLEQIEEMVRIKKDRGQDEILDEILTHIETIKAEVFSLDPHGFTGISSVKTPINSQTAWDIKQSLRHTLAWNRKPTGGIQVDFDEPLQQNRQQPLAVLQRQGQDWLLHMTEEQSLVASQALLIYKGLLDGGLNHLGKFLNNEFTLNESQLNVLNRELALIENKLEKISFHHLAKAGQSMRSEIQKRLESVTDQNSPDSKQAFRSPNPLPNWHSSSKRSRSANRNLTL